MSKIFRKLHYCSDVYIRSLGVGAEATDSGRSAPQARTFSYVLASPQHKHVFTSHEQSTEHFNSHTHPLYDKSAELGRGLQAEVVIWYVAHTPDLEHGHVWSVTQT